MTILWCGGEDIDFPNGTSVPVFDTGSTFRTGYARGSFSLSPFTGVAKSIPLASQRTSLWFSCRIYPQTYAGYEPNKYVGIVDSASGKGIWIGSPGSGTGSSRKLYIYKYDGSTYTLLANSSSASLTANATSKVDINIIDYGASATVNVYVAGALDCTYSGDISISGVAGFDAVWLATAGNNYDGYRTFVSELIMSDESTQTLSLVTLYPNAAGDANAWTGAYTDIDEATISDADLIYSNIADQDAQFGLSNTPAGSFAVDAIKIVARATAPAGSTADTLKLGVKSVGTVDVDTGQALTTSWATYERIAHTINGAQLTTALLDAMQINLRSAE
jgi:hypothetical protein